MSTPMVVFNHVSKHYGETGVLNDFCLEVMRAEIITMIGRSGCGKTTALKLVNGLIKPDLGDVYVDGRRVCECDNTTLRRNICYVIQGVGLFPHMTVGKNIAYVPSLTKKWDRETERIETARLLSIVGLEPRRTHLKRGSTKVPFSGSSVA